MNLKKGQELEVQIESLNIKGQGIGFLELDGQKYNIAVNRSYPGDKVLVSLRKIKKNFLEAQLVKIIEPSKDRVEPQNSYALISGSTPLECLSYEKQLFYKQNEVQRILNNLDLNPKINPIIGMENPYFYRNKMQYSFGVTPDVFEFCLGMHHYKYKFKIVPATDCKLCDPICSPLVDFTLEYFKNSDLKPHDFRDGTGDLRNLTIRTAKNTEDKMLILEVQRPEDMDQYQDYFQKVSQKFPELTSIYLHTTFQRKGHKTHIKLHHVSGKEFLTEKLNIKEKQYTFEILPQAFFQPNPSQAEVIYGLVQDSAKDSNIIYDLFCGTGTIGIVLANKAQRVYGVEIEPQSIQAAINNAGLNQIENIQFLEGDVYKVLKKTKLPNPDLVVVDPPRSGLTDKALYLISDLQPKNLIYVSCNIKTFAQNAIALKEKGYTLESVTPVDQFPHTRHLEIVSKFTFQK